MNTLAQELYLMGLLYVQAHDFTNHLIVTLPSHCSSLHLRSRVFQTILPTTKKHDVKDEGKCSNAARKSEKNDKIPSQYITYIHMLCLCFV
jgi:hypothetical protein